MGGGRRKNRKRFDDRAAPGSGCGPVGERHRHHEHYACHGQRPHPRDRYPQSPRRYQARDSVSIPGRGHPHFTHRRIARRNHRPGAAVLGSLLDRVPNPNIWTLRHRGDRGLISGRNHFWNRPRDPRRQARSSGGLAVRVTVALSYWPSALAFAAGACLRSLNMPVKSSTAIHRDLSVKIGRRGAERLLAGHVWVYRSDIVSADGTPPGALVSVFDERGKFLGTALYSSSSQIALRLLSREPVDDFPGLLRNRICAAIAYREQENRPPRSEEHTSELQSPYDLVCRLLLEKKKRK